jgi:hypothetical protein
MEGRCHGGVDPATGSIGRLNLKQEEGEESVAENNIAIVSEKSVNTSMLRKGLNF